MGNESLCVTDELQWECHLAHQLGEPHIDLAVILGIPGAPRVSAEGLLSVLTGYGHPAVSLRWDDRKLTLQKADGGLLATFEIKF